MTSADAARAAAVREVGAIAAAVARLGSAATVADLAAAAGLDPPVVRRRLHTSGPSNIRPQMRLFAKNTAGGWGLTDRGKALAATGGRRAAG